MGIFELNLTMVVLFLLLAIIPSELYVFGHIFGRSKSYRKALPSRCSSQLELSGTLSPISGLFYSGGGEKIHFQTQSAVLTWVNLIYFLVNNWTFKTCIYAGFKRFDFGHGYLTTLRNDPSI